MVANRMRGTPQLGRKWRPRNATAATATTSIYKANRHHDGAGVRIDLTLQLVKPSEAAEALHTLIRYIEQLEESVRRNKMSEVTLSAEDLRELDEAESEMNQGGSLTLEKFNQGFK